VMVIGAALVLKTVDALADKSVIPLPQNEMAIDQKRLHAPKIFREDCRIDWRKQVVAINNLIRGLSPYPAAWTNFYRPGIEIGVKIFKASVEPTVHQCIPGAILSDNKNFLKIACADGFINLIELQIAGRNRIGISAFLRGFTDASSYTAN
jgi:methionyl-tRNA formyltransferase